jgi:hypothetical protein
MSASHKLVDQSALLGKVDAKVIDTKEKLYDILGDYLAKLFENATEDSKIFWATYSMFCVEEDGIHLCSNMETYSPLDNYPLYDVDVRKSDKTSITIEPYKISAYSSEVVDRINDASLDKLFKTTVSPLDVLGMERDTSQHWEGTVTVRTNFTGWNRIEVPVDLEAIFPNDGTDAD